MELGLGLTEIIPIVVYLVGVLVIFSILFYRIEVGLFFVVPLIAQQSVLERIIDYPGGKDFMDIFFMALVAKSLMLHKPHGDGNKRSSSPDWKKPLYISVISILVWTYISLWIGTFQAGLDSPTSLSDFRFVRWKNFAMLPILYFVVVKNVKDEKNIKAIVILMCLSMLFMDRTFYHNIAGKDMSSYSDDLRVGATFAYLGPNPTAVFYAQNTILILALFIMDKHVWRRWLFGLTVIFNYFCLLFLYSRGGYLATVVSLGFLGLAKDRRITIVLITLLLFWRIILPISVQERIDMSTERQERIDRSTRTYDEQMYDHSIEARFEMWDQATILISKKPILGYGYDSTPYLNIITDEDQYRKSLHNGFLELLLEQGILGFLIFMSFYCIGIYYGWRLYRIGRDPFLKGLGLGFSACVVAVLSGNLAGSYLFYFQVSGFYWTNLALVTAGLELSSKDQRKFKNSYADHCGLHRNTGSSRGTQKSPHFSQM